MSNPAAKFGDLIKANDMHNVINPDGSVVPQILPFNGVILDGCVSNVQINNKPAAIVGSKAKNVPVHVQMPPATSFVKPPTNEGEITIGSKTVLIGGKPAARKGDMAVTCVDAPGLPAQVEVMGPANVLIGG